MMKRMLLLVLAILCLCGCAAAETQAYIVNVDATSWISGKDPSAYVPYRMIDGDEETAFQFSTKTTRLGKEYVYFYFDGAYTIDTLWIKNGFWKYTNGNDQYLRNSRVKKMRVDFQYSGHSNYSDSMTVTLPDDSLRADWTKISLGSRQNVESVRFLIQEIYKGSKYPNDVCISEVRFVSGSSGSSSYSGQLYGLAIQKLATRKGPGTTYQEGGTYEVAGQYIRVISRAWDKRNGIWWVKCEIPYRNETRILWTGYKRFDSSTLPLESIPVEGETVSFMPVVTAVPKTPTPKPAQQPQAVTGKDWSSAYRDFVMNGKYRSSGQAYYSYDGSASAFGLYDMDRDGVPELIATNGDDSMAGKGNYIYTFKNGRVTYLGEAGFRDSQMYYYPNSAYPGLFCSDGNMGLYTTVYYSVSGGKVRSEEVVEYQYYDDEDVYTWLEEPITNPITADQGLLDLVEDGMNPQYKVHQYTAAEISTMGGWEAFVQTQQVAASTDDTAWKVLYQRFITSGEYFGALANPDPELDEALREREQGLDAFALYDMDGDGIPELLVLAMYGIEQADVFTCEGNQVTRLGMMGGDNFFQFIYHFSGYPGLFTIMGGPAMDIDHYTIKNGLLDRQYIGMTIVNDDGDDTIGLRSQITDGTLYNLLYDALVDGDISPVDLPWRGHDSLKTDADWAAFFNSVN